MVIFCFLLSKKILYDRIICIKKLLKGYNLQMQIDKIQRVNIIYPWFDGLSSDLLFWIAIDTLFLSVVKGFSSAQIVSSSTISLVFLIILQIPLLKIIKKIGNTNSVRLGAFMLLAASLTFTFCKSYWVMVIGKILYNNAFTFTNMGNVVLKNNLELKNNQQQYIKLKTKSNTIYSVITMIISFVASIFFNYDHYLPMYFCIFFCFLCFLLSFYIKDYSKYDKITENNENNEKKSIKKEKLHLTKLIVIMIVAYGLFYPVANSGQSDGKLFIQEELLKCFDVSKTSLIIGVMLCISRIVRVVSNLVFEKIYKKQEEKVGIGLSILLSLSSLFMIIGYFLTGSLFIKFSVMALGYIIILFIRDPYRIYVQNEMLNNTEKKNQQSLLTTLEFSRKLIRAGLSLLFSFILIKHTMIVNIFIIFGLSLVSITINFILTNMLKNQKKA